MDFRDRETILCKLEVGISLAYRPIFNLILLRHAKSATLLSHWSRAVANYKQACDWLVACAQNRTGLSTCSLRCRQHDV